MNFDALFVRMLVFGTSISFMGCVMSPSFGEDHLIDVKQKYGLSLPTSPKYSLQALGTDRYSISVHQGSILIAEGETRAGFLRAAAEKVAFEECKALEKKPSNLNLRQVGDSGWVSVTGEFSCVSVPSKKEFVEKSGLQSIGSGFFINSKGYFITNKHVIDGCKEVALLVDGIQSPAKIIAGDDSVDLAVLKTDLNLTFYPRIRSAKFDKLGETIIVSGYPLQGILGTGLNVTTGTISALTGLANNSRFLQISAPVQPGNSGGPVLDENGFVVGVVVAKLNATVIEKWTGDIPQNINFAIKSSYLRGFLESNNIDYESVSEAKKKSVVDVAEQARKYTSPVMCRK